jgi:hypothetical protein
MKRFLVLFVMLALSLALAACKKGHPISVFVTDGFQSTRDDDPSLLVYEKVAVFPFLSALHPSDDPDNVAPSVMEKFLVPELDSRSDYSFIAPNTVIYAIEREGWDADYKAFKESYPRADEADPAFLARLAKTLQCDAFLVPVVDLWQKDEVDVQENSTPATYVGATLTVLDGTRSPGTVLFRATDEAYQEGARSETAARTLVRSSSGIVRSDPGAKAYAAPGFQDVAPRIILALVASLPSR